MISYQNTFKLFSIAILLINLLASCEGKVRSVPSNEKEIPNLYAKGFQVFEGESYWVLTVTKAFGGTHKPFKYLILEDKNVVRPEGDFDAVVTLPIEQVILTSTTQIPHLDLLSSTEKLIGFPNLDLISSPLSRKHIEYGAVRDLGSGAQANVEMMVDLEPDWVMISTMGEDLKHLDLLKTVGIPALINGEYVEQHPLGRAEWIKFTGVLLGKFEQACKVFEEIANEYLEASQLVDENASINRPTVMAGVMYKDIWYVPGNDSWGAQLLKAAGGMYIFDDQEGTGSAQLSYEYVLDQAQDAEFWLGASDYTSLEAMRASDKRYVNFAAFKLGNVYSYTSKKGETGGIEYFELGYMRPDLILKDLIKILHPELLPDYSMYFYAKLDEN
ncbi:ABC transporter substrate-binding protein [Belliella kenyensis]|uniref:ABC transporter substrate-binding protein n=1 Tax=Belliella kenyensis TaxID=1472724 RepID=A0ABV8EHG3_9BACT|nr:ABC transporter substrate-binding protein [Belliella kenyensis]MCH7400955.1 ABC transporter substrate-binding protein [Belliella kenyensis]MDN3603953.1 ABC transporter substrate-binding protein [Belliella kenyensis]